MIRAANRHALRQNANVCNRIVILASERAGGSREIGHSLPAIVNQTTEGASTFPAIDASHLSLGRSDIRSMLRGKRPSACRSENRICDCTHRNEGLWECERDFSMPQVMPERAGLTSKGKSAVVEIDDTHCAGIHCRKCCRKENSP